MEIKWFFTLIGIVVISVCLTTIINTRNATKAGLEECPKLGKSGGDAIWIKSCKEYIEMLEKHK